MLYKNAGTCSRGFRLDVTCSFFVKGSADHGEHGNSDIDICMTSDVCICGYVVSEKIKLFLLDEPLLNHCLVS